MAVLRAGVRAYTDAELLGHLHGHMLASIANLARKKANGTALIQLERDNIHQAAVRDAYHLGSWCCVLAVIVLVVGRFAGAW